MKRLTTSIAALRPIVVAASALLTASILLVTLLWLLSFTPAASALAQPGASVIRVATTGSDSPGCGSSATPCLTVQYAVDQAQPGDEIRVAAGLYTGVQARAGITQVVYISKTVAVHGGYTTSNWNTPNPNTNLAILDAQGQGRVIYITGAISPTITGLRITGGDASGLGGEFWGEGAEDTGGGIYVYQATATISDCVIYDNTASTANRRGNGGGVALVRSVNPTFRGNTVQGNTANAVVNRTGMGGGVFLYQTPAMIQDNLIQNNIASIGLHGDGGGMYIWQSPATVQGNTVQSNIASTGFTGYGGGLNLYDSPAILQDNTILNNIGSTGYRGSGGGIFVSSNSVTIQGNTIQGNIGSTVDEGTGGGVRLTSSSDTLILGNAIISNTATTSPTVAGDGGGLWIQTSIPFTLTNNLIAGNHANSIGSGLGLRGFDGVPNSGHLLHNTIADNDNGGSGQGVYVDSYTTLVLTNTIITGHSVAGLTANSISTVTLEATLWHNNGTTTNGTGSISAGSINIQDDPAFADPATWDYHLTVGSPAIDTGIDAGVNTDIDGESRPQEAGYDIGADEIRTCWARLNDDPTDYATIQAAVDASTQATDVVKVAGYCAGVLTRSGTEQVVYVDKTVTIRGGYTASNWNTPDADANPTTLDAQGGGRVVYITGSISPTLEGLRITGGDATGQPGLGTFTGDDGGGVFVSQAAATINDCVVYSNTASTADDGLGGGILLYQDNSTLVGNVIWDNVASTANWGYGGGLNLVESSATVQNNTIQSNTASITGEGNGGGVYLYQSPAVLQGNTIKNNTASHSTIWDGFGGGAFIFQSPATLVNNTIQGNAAGTDALGEGGGIYIESSVITLQRNRVISNAATLDPTATGHGGGLMAYRTSPITLTNNVVAGNQANTSGSGLKFFGSSGTQISGYLLHNTIADNDGSGQGIYVGPYTTLGLTNTIIAGHSSAGLTVEAGSSVALEATLWHNNGVNTGGAGTISTGAINIQQAPLFVGSGDYHLTANSPANNAGVNIGVPVDIDGEPRPLGAPDIGADEHIEHIYLPLVLRNHL